MANWHTRYLTRKGNSPWSQSLTVQKIIRGFVLLLFCVYKLQYGQTRVDGYRVYRHTLLKIQANVDLYSQESTLINSWCNFNNPGLCPQPTCGQLQMHAWLKKGNDERESLKQLQVSFQAHAGLSYSAIKTENKLTITASTTSMQVIKGASYVTNLRKPVLQPIDKY